MKHAWVWAGGPRWHRLPQHDLTAERWVRLRFVCGKPVVTGPEWRRWRGPSKPVGPRCAACDR